MKRNIEHTLQQRAKELGYELRSSYVLVDPKNMLIVAGEDISLEAIENVLENVIVRRQRGEYQYLK